MRAAFAALLLLGAPLHSQRVQAPDAPWKTLQTAHYRLHYPARGDFEPFAQEVASKIEGIHSRVTAWVGYESPRRVDVVIRDPVLEANGFAVPLLNHPFVELWKTPPESASAIGHYASWPELLVTHELTHIHHMMRPQNRPTLLDEMLNLPVGPVTLKAPRWVLEGYATVIEGKVTGGGRPHGAYRAALLRQWALQGKLPDYGTLNGSAGFRGGNMAYLVGSAYLEWLERRNEADPEILRKFWKQLASKKRRDFDTSFKATFGISPRDGYDRWRAEATHDALEFERRVKAKGLLREGEVWTLIPGEVTDLSVSPDGSKLLARVLTKEVRGLMVWDLTQPPHLGHPLPKKPPEKNPDPNEVEDRPQGTQARPPKWTLPRLDGSVPRSPTWDPRNPGRVRFVLYLPDGEGTLVPAEFMWMPGVGFSRAPSVAAVEKKEPRFRFATHGGIWNIEEQTPNGGAPKWLTRTLSAAWNPAPTPDGKWLYYTQLTALGCEIRKLDLSLPPLGDDPLPSEEIPITPRTILPPSDEKSELPPPVPPPAARDYTIAETLWNGLRMGVTVAPSGKSYEVGYGGSDLLGRLSWQALGAFGDGAGPRGATAALAYRGWRWAPGIQVYSSLERPSAQAISPIQGFDRQRSGAEFGLTYESRNTTPAFLHPVLSFDRTRFQDGAKPEISRDFAGLEFGIRHFWGRGEHWGLRVSAEAKGAAGRSGGQDWQFQRGQVQVRFSTPWLPLVLKAESARVSGDPTSLDRLHLGGLATSLTPASLEWNRVEQPGLPSYSATGDRMSRLRMQVGTGLRAYLEHTAVWDHLASRTPFTKVAGLEFDLMEAAGRDETLERLVGHLTFTAGIHRTLADSGSGHPMHDRTVATLSLVLRP